MLLNLSPGISILIAIASSTIEKIIALYVTEWVEYPGFDLSRSGETWMAPVFKLIAFCMIKWIFFGTYTSQSKKSENWISVFLATDCEALKDNEVAPVSSSAVFPSSSTITGFFFLLLLFELCQVPDAFYWRLFYHAVWWGTVFHESLCFFMLYEQGGPWSFRPLSQGHAYNKQSWAMGTPSLSLEPNAYSLSTVKHLNGLCKRLLYKGRCDIGRGHLTLCVWLCEG